jgi:hypothetical protein
MSFKLTIINAIRTTINSCTFRNTIINTDGTFAQGGVVTPRKFYIDETSSNFDLDKNNGMDYRLRMSSWSLSCMLEFPPGRIDTGDAEDYLKSNIVLTDSNNRYYSLILNSVKYAHPAEGNPTEGSIIELEFNVKQLAN